MTKQRVQQLTDIMARVLYYQDSDEPDWATMDYAATKHEYDELPKPIIDRYRNDAKFHAQVQRAVSMLLELDRSSAEPEALHWQQSALPGGGTQFTAPAPGDIVPERPTSKPGPSHRWHFEDGVYKCWDCPATFGFPQNRPGDV
jgi:hypothetical protein